MLSITELLYAVLISTVLIVGGYQFYFIPQKIHREIEPGRSSRLDERIPFDPRWVWIYSLAYYPFIISPIIILTGVKQFYIVCACYIMLLVLHIFISLQYPMKTPPEWRAYRVENSTSKRFLSFIQRIDKGGNCYPSMHVAVAVMAALHWTSFGYSEYGLATLFVWIAPVAISASAVLTKQHFVRDLFPGFLLAVVTFVLYYLCFLPFVIDPVLVTFAKYFS